MLGHAHHASERLALGHVATDDHLYISRDAGSAASTSSCLRVVCSADVLRTLIVAKMALSMTMLPILVNLCIERMRASNDTEKGINSCKGSTEMRQSTCLWYTCG